MGRNLGPAATRFSKSHRLLSTYQTREQSYLISNVLSSLKFSWPFQEAFANQLNNNPQPANQLSRRPVNTWGCTRKSPQLATHHTIVTSATCWPKPFSCFWEKIPLTKVGAAMSAVHLTCITNLILTIYLFLRLILSPPSFYKEENRVGQDVNPYQPP